MIDEVQRLRELAEKLAAALGLLGELDGIEDWMIKEKISKDLGRNNEHNILVRENSRLYDQQERLRDALEPFAMLVVQPPDRLHVGTQINTLFKSDIRQAAIVLREVGGKSK